MRARARCAVRRAGGAHLTRLCSPQQGHRALSDFPVTPVQCGPPCAGCEKGNSLHRVHKLYYSYAACVPSADLRLTSPSCLQCPTVTCRTAWAKCAPPLTSSRVSATVSDAVRSEGERGLDDPPRDSRVCALRSAPLRTVATRARSARAPYAFRCVCHVSVCLCLRLCVNVSVRVERTSTHQPHRSPIYDLFRVQDARWPDVATYAHTFKRKRACSVPVHTHPCMHSAHPCIHHAPQTLNHKRAHWARLNLVLFFQLRTTSHRGGRS